jgi:hypothetical protein
MITLSVPPILSDANPAPIDRRVRITPGDPVLLIESPPGEKRWGFYQFPDMWRAPSGEIYCAVNVGHDSPMGQHEPSRFFVSRDEGKTWKQVPFDQVNRAPHVVRFRDGSDVSFGTACFIYHAQCYGPLQNPAQLIHPRQHGNPPRSGLLPCGYLNTYFQLYRYADLPEKERSFERASRPSPDAPWQRDTATVEMGELHYLTAARNQWWNEKGEPVGEDISPWWFKAWPHWGPYDIAVLDDDTLVWAVAVGNPACAELNRPIWGVALMASTDKGRTWKLRGMVAHDTDRSLHGYSCDEHSLQRMPNGDLLCVMRTLMGDQKGESHWLAAARSSDGGFTWSKPEPIAPFSVTPILMTLENGCVAVAYGRPGVYVRGNSDSGKSWSESVNVVGPREQELLGERWWDVWYDDNSSTKISCGNLGAVVTGSDRFLLAYSDFRHRQVEGKWVKAVMVREFVVSGE